MEQDLQRSVFECCLCKVNFHGRGFLKDMCDGQEWYVCTVWRHFLMLLKIRRQTSDKWSVQQHISFFKNDRQVVSILSVIPMLSSMF